MTLEMTCQDQWPADEEVAIATLLFFLIPIEVIDEILKIPSKAN